METGTLTGYLDGLYDFYNPAVTGVLTSTTTNILTNSATLNGYWSTNSANASILGFQVGTSTGNYTSNFTSSGNYSSRFYSIDISSLTGGTTYYYRAEAYAGSWYYGSELTFTTLNSVSVDSFLSSNINTTYADLSGIVQNLNGNTNYTVRGVLTSTDNITWSGGKSETGNWTGTGQILANNGFFNEHVSFLSENTTYYWKAFAGNGVTGLGYGDVKTFTTLSIAQQTNVPVLQALSVNLYGTDNQTSLNALNFNSVITQSDTPIVLKGVQYSIVYPTVQNITLLGGIQYQVGTWNGTYDNSQFVIPTDGSVGTYSIVTNYSILSGATVYWRAYAQNSAGLGFSSSANFSLAGGGYIGLVVQTHGSTVNGNSVTLNGYWRNNSNASSPSAYLFSWGETVTGDTNQIQVSVDNGFTHTQGGLKTSTLYYWRVGVIYQGATIWSDLPASTFTTGTGIIAITGVCDITTLPVLSFSSTSFNGSMSINAVNSGNASQIGFYVSYNQNGSGGYKLPIATSGNYGVGTYNGTIAGLNANALVYYAAYAINTAGENIGLFVGVQLSASGVAYTPPPAPIVSDFSDILRAQMRSLNLDNTTGHWVYMFLWILLVSFIFGGMTIYLVHMKELLLAKITAGLWVLITAVITGIFTWSGLLGWWPIIITVLAAVAGIGLLISIFTNKNSVAE